MQRILVPGANGQVGWELLTALEPLGTVIGLDRSGMDLASPDSIRRAIRDAKPDIIINADAVSNDMVDFCVEPGILLSTNAISA